MSRLHGDGLGLPIGGVGSPLTSTPVITWAGNTATAEAKYIHTPGSLQMWVQISESAGTAAAVVNIPLPAGLVAASFSAGGNFVAGRIYTNAGGSGADLVITSGGTTVVSVTNVTGAVTTWLAYINIPVTT